MIICFVLLLIDYFLRLGRKFGVVLHAWILRPYLSFSLFSLEATEFYDVSKRQSGKLFILIRSYCLGGVT
uniref:Uncharacterized protein n=1 Tax=Rhizophora mucronata TaxID=61149 RepID=A0A2P2L7J0_RHIMU